jgi:hypothetical protein
MYSEPIEHSESLAGAYPISFEAGIPNPARIPPAPDEVLAHIRQFHRGLTRVTIKLWQGRKRYGQINAIIIGAKHDELPRASVDQIVRAVMSVAQDYHEGVDTLCKFMIQAHVYLKPTGDPVRKAIHFELGGNAGDSFAYAEEVSAPDHLDTVLLSHIRECHREIIDQAKVISEIGREAISNAGQVFAYKQDALDAQAAANSVILDARRDEREAAAGQQKWERGFKLLEKAVNTGIAQGIVSSATGISLPMPAGTTMALPPTAAVAPSVESTPTPSWARAASGIDTVAPVTPTAPTAAPPPEDDSIVGKAKHLYASVTAEQWPELFEALTVKQVKQLKMLKDPPDDAAVLTAAGGFREGIKDNQMRLLGGILTVEQLAAVLELAGAAEAAQYG